MILEQYRGVFEKIYIFSPSINIDDGWIPVKKYIEEDLGVNTEREQAYYDEWDEAALRPRGRRADFGLVCWVPGPLERGAHRAGAGKNRLFFQQAVLSAFGLVCWVPGPLERGAHRAGAGKNRLFFQQAVLSAFGLVCWAPGPLERGAHRASREEPSVFSAGCLVSFWVGLLGARAPRERRSPGGRWKDP